MRDWWAHERPEQVSKRSIFLAGPSPRRQADFNWRPEALAYLETVAFDGDVFIPLPRNGNWLPDYDAQVEWELTYLHLAWVIAFWVPRSKKLPGYTTNVEYGLFVGSGKVVLGYPTDAPKMRYLHYLANTHKVPVAHSLPETLNLAIKKL